MEHYVTLCSWHFLPQFFALLVSLRRHSPPFRLWVVAMDDKMVTVLEKMTAPEVGVIPLDEIENEKLLSLKGTRSVAEYCWTVATFSYEAVFNRASSATRVTYLDADLWFLRSPKILIDQLIEANGDILITEHGFDSSQKKLRDCGRYCVQFITITRTQAALRVLHWWQDRCIEWCYARVEDGKFGDQKYLEQWPSMLPGGVVVVRPSSLCVGPWNARGALVEVGVKPVFLHAHGLRIMNDGRVRLWDVEHLLGLPAQRLWGGYLQDFMAGCRMVKLFGCDLAFFEERMPVGLRSLMRWIVLREGLGKRCYVELDG